MAKTQNEEGVHIGEMLVRIPGENAEFGQRIGQTVGQRLVDHIPNTQRGRIGTLNVRIEPPANATESDLSNAIGEAIAKLVRKDAHG